MTATLEGRLDGTCTAAQARQFAGCVVLLTEAHGVDAAAIAQAIATDRAQLDAYLVGGATPSVAQLRAVWKLALRVHKGTPHRCAR